MLIKVLKHLSVIEVDLVLNPHLFFSKFINYVLIS